MKTISNDQRATPLIQKSIVVPVDQTQSRRAVFSLLGLLTLSGCSSSSWENSHYSANVYYGHGNRYYGRSTYNRSPARRSHGGGRRR